jgi:hypothetical protein
VIVTPSESLIDHRAQRRKCRVVAVVEGKIFFRIAHAIAEHLEVAPLQQTSDRFGIGIEEDLIGIETMPLVRSIGSVYAIAVKLAWPEAGEIAVPNPVPLFRKGDPVRFGSGFRRIEKAKLDVRRVLGEDGEIDSQSVPGRTERIGDPRFHLHHSATGQDAPFVS